MNPVGTDILDNLERKAKLVDWRKGERKEYFVLFSRSGFTENLEKLAGERGDLLLWKQSGLCPSRIKPSVLQ